MPDLSRIQTVYQKYVDARNALLNELNLKRRSNRDPLSEFSEWLVKELVEGTLAENPVQKAWDIQTLNGDTYQVKYLANSADKWVNVHPILVNEMMNYYTLVIFESLLPQAVIIFPVQNLALIGKELRKKHLNLDISLQFTQSNYNQIISNPALFKNLGVRLYLPPNWDLQ